MGENLSEKEQKELAEADTLTVANLMDTFNPYFERTTSFCLEKDIFVIVLILKYNNREHTVKFVFLTKKTKGLFTESMLIDSFKDVLWERGFSQLCTYDVLLQAIQIRRLMPSYRISNTFTNSFVQPGVLRASQYNTTNQLFAIKTGNQLLRGSRADHTIKVAFLIENLKTPNSQNIGDSIIILEYLKKFFTTDIEFSVQDENQVHEATFRLLISTKRSKAPTPFMPVNSIAFLGFVPMGSSNNIEGNDVTLP